MGVTDDVPTGLDQTFGPSDQDKMVRVDPRCTAVFDGFVRISVDRYVAWLKASKEYSTMNVGPTCSPMGLLLVDIPVEGVKAGQPLTPEQFAEVMRVTSTMLGPAALSFATLIENDFGLPNPDEPDAWT